jgi:hypothetical protein
MGDPKTQLFFLTTVRSFGVTTAGSPGLKKRYLFWVAGPGQDENTTPTGGV